MPGPEETDDADRTYDKSDKESSSSHGSSPSEEEKGAHSPDRKSKSSSPARSCSRSRLSRSPSPCASRSRSRSRSVSHPKRERQRSHSSDRHSRRRKPLRRSPDHRHRSRERGSRDADRRRSYSRERRSHRGSRRSRSRSRSWDRKSRRSRSRERWREGASRRSAHHYRRGHTRRGSRSRSRSRRCSRDRSRSRSRGGSHRRMLRDKPEKGMPMKQALEEGNERKSSSAALMAATAAAAALNVDTSQDEKSSMGLPLNTSKPGGPMTPQMAVQQAMAVMNAKAQQMTGIPLPTYYNPAAVNPLKYAEQVQKRKLLWQNKEKTETNHNTTSSVWENLTFSQDQDGKMTAKFRKLMGIKSDTPSDTQKPQDSFKKQEELFRDLDHQYEVARMSTHTHRGVGLGYSSQPTAIFPPSK